MEVFPFLPDRHSNAEHQGVEKEIMLRDYAVENIESISIDGETYAVDRESIPAELKRIGMATEPGRATGGTPRRGERGSEQR